MAELSHENLTPPEALPHDNRPVEIRPQAARTAPARPPIGVIVIGLVLLGALGFIIFRSFSGKAVPGGNKSGPSAQQALSGPPLATPAMASGAQLPAPELVTEIKVPSTGDKPPRPRDVAVDGQGNVYIAYDNDNTIRKVDPKGNVVASWGNNTSGHEPAFKELFGLVVDPGNNTLYALDSGASAALRFDLQGAPKGEPISGLGYYPRGIALAPNGELLVADSGGQRIVRVNAQGSIAGEIGKPPQGSTDGTEPVDAVVAQNGDIYLFDARNDRIQQFKPDGQLVKQWSVPNNVAARDSGHLAIDQHDRIYFAGVDKKEITVFSSTGEILGVWPQESGEAPVGIFVDKQDNMFVTYPESGTVRKFKLPTPPQK